MMTAMVDSSFPLAMVQEGDRVKISQLRAGNSLELRLASMGLNVGSEIVVSQRAGCDLVVIRGETRLALGLGMAQKIMVTPLA